ncbi:MAG: ribose-phosphate diphosphokinase [Proteobacteria bacterium]|nr:ribose-phosphate diphosphokinase [Pseudomonadota bacterium]
MTVAVFAFDDDQAPAERLAAELGVPHHPVHLRRFPDGEALPTVAVGYRTALIYRGLDHPDPKVVPLLLAADALRRSGVERLVLVAPYFPYLRQDRSFAPGQPVSREVVGRLLAAPFDGLVTLQPRLEGAAESCGVFGGRPVTALSAAELFAHAIGRERAPLVVCAGGEDGRLAIGVAAQLGAEALTLDSAPAADGEPSLTPPAGLAVSGRRAVLVAGVCSTGGRLIAAAETLRRAGARSIDALVAHALYDSAAAARLRHAGVRRVVSTDSCRHPSNGLFLAGLLANALRKELEP